MLTEEKRPKKLDDVIGQTKAVKFLNGWLKKYKTDGTADAFLIHGPSGSGKTSIAHAICGDLACDWGVKFVPSRECTIDAVRVIAEELNYSMLNGEKWRVVICDEAHLMSEPAKNAWLSLLERLPQFRLVIFTTTEPLSFDLVWRSRCKMIAVNVLEDDWIETALIEAAGARKVPANVIKQIASTCAGNLRAAYHELEKHLLTVTVEEDEQAVTTEEIVHPDSLADTNHKRVIPTINEQISALPVPSITQRLSDQAPVKFTTRPGLREGYMEVVFEGKPDEDIRRRLKAKGFRWNGKTKCWWGKSAGFPLARELHACEPVGGDEVGDIVAVLDIDIKVPEAIVEECKARAEELGKELDALKAKAEEEIVPCTSATFLPIDYHKKNIDKRKAVLNPPELQRDQRVCKKPRGLQVLASEDAFVIAHEASQMDIGLPHYKTYGEAADVMDKVIRMADWTLPAEEVLAIEGLAEQLVAFLPEDEEETVEAIEKQPETFQDGPKSWKVWVKTAGNGESWSTNAKCYSTEDAAKEAGDSLMMRWMAVTEMEVRPSEEAANDVEQPVEVAVEAAPAAVAKVLKGNFAPAMSAIERMKSRARALAARR